jgi:thiol-disulfide isomerase/thioredoxin
MILYWLQVYAPWCGHCKQLEPVFKKLAKRFAKVDSVVIAKMDGTENEHPELEVKGFPTLFFVPAEKGAKPIPYDAGDRSLKV